MSSPAQTSSVTPVNLLVDFVLVAAFFTLIYSLLRSHVPSDNPDNVRLWATLGTACMSGVFWLCIQMFRVVLRAQLAAKKEQ
ncbi:MAG: hypothetical protein WCL04_01635 [Verrucomicrobiota bacterium]